MSSSFQATNNKSKNAKGKKKRFRFPTREIVDIALILLAALAVASLFVNFLNYVTTFGGKHVNTTSSTLFGKFNDGILDITVKDYLDGTNRGGYFFYVLAKIATVVGIISAIVIAVVAFIKLFNIKLNLNKVERIFALVAIIAGAIILVSMVIFFIVSAVKGDGTNFAFTGAKGWYFAFIGVLGSGLISKFAHFC